MQIYQRLIIVTFYLIQVSCNNNNGSDRVLLKSTLPVLPTHINCDTTKVDSLLKSYAEAFIPTKLGLDKCLPYSFDTLLNSLDTGCLRNIPHYKYSILLVLLKLYDYHIRVGHQGYDLYLMKSGTSKIIISEFELIGGYNKERLEMLNSGTILDVIDKENQLKTNPVIKKYYKQISTTIRQQEKAGY